LLDGLLKVVAVGILVVGVLTLAAQYARDARRRAQGLL
jgi:hypothetical protein